jgi:TonB family protein
VQKIALDFVELLRYIITVEPAACSRLQLQYNRKEDLMAALALNPLSGNRLGGLEIRRFVQKYMGIGLGVSIAVHFMLLGTYQIVSYLIDRDLPPPVQVYTLSDTILPPPPIMKDQEQTLSSIKIPEPKILVSAIIKPVDYELPPDAPLVSKQEDIDKYLVGLRDSLKERLGDAPLSISQPIPEADVIPPPTTFTPFQQEPKLVYSVQPDYPGMARIAAVSGKVWVKYYIDKKGDVREVLILKASPEGLGFEEESAKALRQWKFTPAIQDKHPVGVWVGQTIVFKIQ